MKLTAILLSLILAACATQPVGRRSEPADAFLQRLSALCGQAFEGQVEVDAPTPSPDFAGKRLVMHVRDCAPGQVRVPFHVGEDRSRTWIVTRTTNGLRLKHDHRHADGSPDALTMYGGETVEAGSAGRQAFPLDAGSRALFERENRPASLTNTWAMEIEPGRAFVYELSRPGGRLFRVRFDLSRPVPPHS
jgi:hypothetical protein